MTNRIAKISVSISNLNTGHHSELAFEQTKKSQMSKTQLFAVLNAIVGSPETLEHFLDKSFDVRDMSKNRVKSTTSDTIGNHLVSLELPIMEHEHNELFCDTIHPIIIDPQQQAVSALIDLGIRYDCCRRG